MNLSLSFTGDNQLLIFYLNLEECLKSERFVLGGMKELLNSVDLVFFILRGVYFR